MVLQLARNLSYHLHRAEAEEVDALLADVKFDDMAREAVTRRAVELVEEIRATPRKAGELEAFLQHFALTSEEGLALMVLAEALLRIPDAATRDALIEDRLTASDWHMDGQVEDWLVRLSALGLGIGSKVLRSVLAKVGAPVMRRAILEAVKIMGRQFVLGETIESAMSRAAAFEKQGYRVSYDRLGEAARTQKDADRYFDAYQDVLTKMKSSVKGRTVPPGLSVKLSALHPRYFYAQKEACIPALTERVVELARLAADRDLSLTIDAEECHRLGISLDIFENVLKSKLPKGWDGFGLAVQAYQTRCPAVLDWLEEISVQYKTRLQVRLVKGAYWDTEIKMAQIEGLSQYPVFTRKANTDLSWLVCAQRLLEKRDMFYPMLATHNAHNVAAVLEMTNKDHTGFEFQRLHGMGETLYDHLIKDKNIEVCVYAPVGPHEDLLPYLVRRLLENGANSSFVHKLRDPTVAPESLVKDPVTAVELHPVKRHRKIPLPKDLYGHERLNSRGFPLYDHAVISRLKDKYAETFAGKKQLNAAPLINGDTDQTGTPRKVFSPSDTSRLVGYVFDARKEHVDNAFGVAKAASESWSRVAADKRAEVLEAFADKMEDEMESLMAICAVEAGKTIPDALAEVREAVDFCRYYAVQGRKDFDKSGLPLPGPTGETDVLTLEAQGIFVCISPWNFPLAIFTGQIVAAIMAGNAVIAKPAEQTSLIACRAAELLLESGLPKDVLTLLPGDGEIGAALVQHPDVGGVAFTGSTEVARLINRTLAAKDGPIVPLIAETGGQNVMIVDSSALTEQVVDDVVLSGFGSTGQRCSALRVLYLQDDIADRTIEMIKGAMACLRLGDPSEISSDLGPVIDKDALKILLDHKSFLETHATILAEAPLDKALEASGHFFAPVLAEIDSIRDLPREIFGPVIHVVRYAEDRLEQVMQDIIDTGYGLTFGVHSRIATRIAHLADQAKVGNVYVNRTMTGAVVGVQPFGGRGLSGTGPKAGGPHYLHRFATEKVVTINTTASGGNASLVSIGDDG